MLALVVVEWLALAEIVLFDAAGQSWSTGVGLVGLYFLVCSATLLLQLAGILFVAAGRYRLGGVLQIVASGVHVIKLEGVIGVVGGIKAYRYPERSAAGAALERA
jgi:hypothetical protein